MTIHYFGGESVNSIMIQAFDRLLTQGTETGSRNGAAVFLNDVEIELTNPRARHLNLIGRKSNIFQLIAETIWVMAGKDELYPYLAHFLPRAPNYSDDGKTWRGAYGPRIYNFDQLQGVVDTFVNDSEATRRATVFIHDPAKDAPSVIRDTIGKTRDTPCNLMMLCYTDRNGEFVTRTIQRSGDAIFGAGSINLFEFSFIHEMLLSCVNNALAEKNPEHSAIQLGPYRHSTVNFHLYDSTRSQAEEVLISGQPTFADGTSTPTERHAVFPATVAGCRHIASRFIDDIAVPLLAAVHTPEKAKSMLEDLFNAHSVTCKNNALFDYMSLTLAYIISTRKVDPVTDFLFNDIHNHGLGVALYDAVQTSSFRKFRMAHELSKSKGRAFDFTPRIDAWVKFLPTGQSIADMFNNAK